MVGTAAAHPVFVDAAIHHRGGRTFCHVFSEDPAALRAIVADLRTAARRLGVPAGWFDGKSWPHYDLPSGLRGHAIGLGAVPADRYTTLEVAWRMQGRLTSERVARLASLRARSPVGGAIPDAPDGPAAAPDRVDNEGT